MLIAAMILGLIGGISYFIRGITLAVILVDPPWWVVSLIIVGIVSTIGSALILQKPSQQVYKLFPLSAILLLLAGLSAIVVVIQSYSCDDAIKPYDIIPHIITSPTMMDSILYNPLNMFFLISAGIIAIIGRQKTAVELEF